MGAGLASATETKITNVIGWSTLSVGASRESLTESEEGDEKSRRLHIEN